MEQYDRRRRERQRDRRMEILLQARANAACQSDDPKATEFLRSLADEIETMVEPDPEPEPEPARAPQDIDPATILMMRPEIGIGVSVVTRS